MNNKTFFQQITQKDLSLFSYYIESNQEAVIIDPQRNCDQYLKILKQRNAKLKYIFLTHIHADFVAGHLPLSKKTGASIIIGGKSNPEFKCIKCKENDQFKVGNIQIKVIETPGHTVESCCFLTIENQQQSKLFTGDTLFLGEVGRPDLVVSSDYKLEDLAGMLFNSLQKLKKLNDNNLVYPAHGSGSPCGKNIQQGNVSTIQEQKNTNYAMNINNKNEFIFKVTQNIPAPPIYFKFDVLLNKSNHLNDIQQILKKSLIPLNHEQFQTQMLKNNTVILDTRSQSDYQDKHIPKSLFLPLNIRFSIFTGSLVEPSSKILLITYKGKEKEAILKLIDIGYDNVIGYLQNGIEGWKGKLDTINKISVEELLNKNGKEGALQIIDVRNKHEYINGHLFNAKLLTLTEAPNLHELHLNRKDTFYLYCGLSTRAQIAYSYLQNQEYWNCVFINGGIDKIEENGGRIVKDI